MARRRHDWMARVRQRQENTLQEDIIRNAPSVEGSLVRGGRRLTTVQRIGAAIIGGAYLSIGAAALFLVIDVVFYDSAGPVAARPFVLVVGMVVGAAFSYLGVRMLCNGLRGGKSVASSGPSSRGRRKRANADGALK